MSDVLSREAIVLGGQATDRDAAITEAGHCGDLLELGPDLVGVERRPVPMAEQKIVLVP